MKLLEAQAELIDRLEAVARGAPDGSGAQSRGVSRRETPFVPSSNELSTGARRHPVPRSAGRRSRASRYGRSTMPHARPPLAREQHPPGHGSRERALPDLPRRPPTAICSSISSTTSLPRFGWELFAWCLLGNHLHFVVRAEPDGALSRHAAAQERVRDAVPPPTSHERSTSSSARTTRGRSSPRSISTGPAATRSGTRSRHGFVERAEDWEWSSFRASARLAPAAARAPRLRAVRPLLAARGATGSDSTSCAPSCERTTSTRDDPGVDVLIEGFGADAVALARLLAGEGNRGAARERGTRARRRRGAPRARHRRRSRASTSMPTPASRRSPTSTSGRPRSRPGSRGSALGAARVSCLGDLLLERWRRAEHRHHGHRRQDHDDRAHRRDPPPRRHRRRRERGRPGREPLADRRPPRAARRLASRGRDDAPPRADELPPRLHALEPHPRSGDLVLARSPGAPRQPRPVPRREGADRAPSEAGRPRRRQRRRRIGRLRGRNARRRLGALARPQRRARRLPRPRNAASSSRTGRPRRRSGTSRTRRPIPPTSSRRRRSRPRQAQTPTAIAPGVDERRRTALARATVPARSAAFPSSTTAWPRRRRRPPRRSPATRRAASSSSPAA